MNLVKPSGKTRYKHNGLGNTPGGLLYAHSSSPSSSSSSSSSSSAESNPDDATLAAFLSTENQVPGDVCPNCSCPFDGSAAHNCAQALAEQQRLEQCFNAAAASASMSLPA